MPTAFERAFAIVIGEEGGLSLNPADSGNWTGGVVGQGVLRGTKYGISAAAHPDLDITGLTLDAARQLYKAEYWNAVSGDELPPTLALVVFDAAVNSGVKRAALWLQASLGVLQDEKIGPVTLAAVQTHTGHGADVQAEFMAQRMVFMAGLPTWRTFGLGWARRLARLPYLTAEMLDV